MPHFAVTARTSIGAIICELAGQTWKRCGGRGATKYVRQRLTTNIKQQSGSEINITSIQSDSATLLLHDVSDACQLHFRHDQLFHFTFFLLLALHHQVQCMELIKVGYTEEQE